PVSTQILRAFSSCPLFFSPLASSGVLPSPHRGLPRRRRRGPGWRESASSLCGIYVPSCILFCFIPWIRLVELIPARSNLQQLGVKLASSLSSSRLNGRSKLG
uniref:Uncharacterized protein n=1 Tax=Triticum urartu TaxID=4572 RepID=A0A8R7TS74_TRIUA